MHVDLPEPDSEARQHSARVTDCIGAAIDAAGGWIDFAHYMQLALYAPGLGYYSAGAAKFGPAGDFVTAPEISSLFSRCLARQCADLLARTNGRDVLELGAGSGAMAAEMLQEFARLDAVPDRYLILEPSADLRARQSARIAELPPQLAGRVTWLDSGPGAPIDGVIVANEVLDALPVRRFLVTAPAAIAELGVSRSEAGFVWQPRAADAALSEAVRGCEPDPGWPVGYCSEWCAQLSAWLREVGGWLGRGTIVLLDYGYSRREYYLPERSSGTLRCYYRHRAHSDPFFWPGLQDISAWVDFTAVAEAATETELAVTGYTTQSQFLLAGGIEALVARPAAADDPRMRSRVGAELRSLLLPGEMGDAVKVMTLARGTRERPTGMDGRDLRGTLTQALPQSG